MRSEVAKRIINRTSDDTKIFARRYAALVVRLHDALISNHWTQKDLAIKLGKHPSEISKWLKGEHNLTLKSVAKLEAELGELFLDVPPSRNLGTFPSREATIRFCCTGYHSKIANDKFEDKWETVHTSKPMLANAG